MSDQNVAPPCPDVPGIGSAFHKAVQEHNQELRNIFSRGICRHGATGLEPRERQGPSEASIAIRAAVDVIIPPGMNRGLPGIRKEFLALADALERHDVF